MSGRWSEISGDSTDTGPDFTRNTAEYSAKQEAREMKNNGQSWSPLCQSSLDYISQDHTEDYEGVQLSRCEQWVANLPDEFEPFEELVFEPELEEPVQDGKLGFDPEDPTDLGDDDLDEQHRNPATFGILLDDFHPFYF